MIIAKFDPNLVSRVADSWPMLARPLFTSLFCVLALALCAGMEKSSESSFRTPSSSSKSPPGELKRSPSRTQHVKPPIEVDFSAYFIDRDVIRIAQQIYTSLHFYKFLDTLSPSESIIDENVLYLSVVGPNDEFKVFSKGTKAALVIPVDDLQVSKKPFYRLTWSAQMERTKDSKERYLYTLEADYSITRTSTPGAHIRHRMSKRGMGQNRRSSKKATISGSRSVSRSGSCNDFKEMEESPESEDSEDPYRAEYRLSSVSILLQNID